MTAPEPATDVAFHRWVVEEREYLPHEERRGRRHAYTHLDPSTRGLRVILVADACAAMRDQDHNATLHVVHRTFGDVRPTDEVIELVRVGAR